jgi:hypothetical protein
LHTERSKPLDFDQYGITKSLRIPNLDLQPPSSRGDEEKENHFSNIILSQEKTLEKPQIMMMTGEIQQQFSPNISDWVL